MVTDRPPLWVEPEPRRHLWTPSQRGNLLLGIREWRCSRSALAHWCRLWDRSQSYGSSCHLRRNRVGNASYISEKVSEMAIRHGSCPHRIKGIEKLNKGFAFTANQANHGSRHSRVKHVLASPTSSIS